MPGGSAAPGWGGSGGTGGHERKRDSLHRFTAIVPAGRPATGSIDCLTEVCGHSLLHHTLAAAGEAGLERRIVIAGDDEVAAAADACGARVVRPSCSLAATRAEATAAETAVRHVLDVLAAEDRETEYVVLLAPELPLRRSGRVVEACATLLRDRADSLFSCNRESPFFWRPSPQGLIPFYDPQLRQAHENGLADVWLHENGSIYVFRSAGLRRYENRLFGRITRLEMDPIESLRVTDAESLAACASLLQRIGPAAEFLLGPAIPTAEPVAAARALSRPGP